MKIFNFSKHISKKEQIKSLEHLVSYYKKQVEESKEQVKQLRHEIQGFRQAQLLEDKERLRLEDPLVSDHFKVEYVDGLTNVYFNGNKFHGIEEFTIDYDTSQYGQIPMLCFRTTGDLEIVNGDSDEDK